MLASRDTPRLRRHCLKTLAERAACLPARLRLRYCIAADLAIAFSQLMMMPSHYALHFRHYTPLILHIAAVAELSLMR
jgi:hypothetical protein